MLRITNLVLARGAKRLLDGAEHDRPRRPQGRADRRQRLRQVEPVRAAARRTRRRCRQRRAAGGVDDRPRRAGNARTAPLPAIEFVLDGDAELRSIQRAARARRKPRTTPTRTPAGEALADLHHRFEAIGGYAARVARRDAALRARLPGRAARRSGGELLRRLADAPQPRAGADVPLRPAAARRADQPPRPRRRAVARGLARPLPGHAAAHHPRPRFPRRRRQRHRPRRPAEARRPTAATTRSSSASAAQQLALQQASYAKQQRQIAHLQSFVDRFRAKATKAKQAQSRIKALERMERIAAAHVDSPFEFTFAPAGLAARQLVRLEHVTLGYDGRRRRSSPTSTGPSSPASGSACSGPTAPASRRC